MTNQALMDQYISAVDESRDLFKTSQDLLLRTPAENELIAKMLQRYGEALHTAFKRNRLYRCEHISHSPIAVFHFMRLAHNVTCLDCMRSDTDQTMRFIDNLFPSRCDLCCRDSDEPLARVYGNIFVITFTGRICVDCFRRADEQA